MKKRIFTLLALLVLLPVMAFAADVVITWEWMLDDPQVTGFRYQLDAEDPDNWTVVAGDTSSCVFQQLDGTKDYTLYLQQTFDGVNWSPSAMSTALALMSESPTMEAEAVVVEEDEVVAVEEKPVAKEEVAVVEAKPEVAIVEEKPEAKVEVAKVEAKPEAKAEVAIVEAKPEAKADKSYYTSISLRGSGVYALDTIVGTVSYDNLSASAGIGLGFNNIVSLSKVIGLGFNINADLLLAPVAGNARDSLYSFFTNRTITDYSLRVTLAPEVEFNLGRFTVDIAGLVDVTLVDYPYVGALDIAPDYYDHFLLGYGGQLGLAFNATDNLQIGVDAKFRRFGGLAGQWGAEVTPTIKLKF